MSPVGGLSWNSPISRAIFMHLNPQDRASLFSTVPGRCPSSFPKTSRICLAVSTEIRPRGSPSRPAVFHNSANIEAALILRLQRVFLDAKGVPFGSPPGAEGLADAGQFSRSHPGTSR